MRNVWSIDSSSGLHFFKNSSYIGHFFRKSCMKKSLTSCFDAALKALFTLYWSSGRLPPHDILAIISDCLCSIVLTPSKETPATINIAVRAFLKQLHTHTYPLWLHSLIIGLLHTWIRLDGTEQKATVRSCGVGLTSWRHDPRNIHKLCMNTRLTQEARFCQCHREALVGICIRCLKSTFFQRSCPHNT